MPPPTAALTWLLVSSRPNVSVRELVASSLLPRAWWACMLHHWHADHVDPMQKAKSAYLRTADASKLMSAWESSLAL